MDMSKQANQPHELVDYKHKLLLCRLFNHHNNGQRHEQHQVVKYKQAKILMSREDKSKNRI